MENNQNNNKDIAKEKIILFVIGVLVGAVISTGAFFAYIKLAGIGSNNGNNQSMQMPGGTPPEMPSGEGQPPEMPNNNTNNNSSSSNSSQSDN